MIAEAIERLIRDGWRVTLSHVQDKSGDVPDPAPPVFCVRAERWPKHAAGRDPDLTVAVASMAAQARSE